jgi:hypothetical protein
MQNKNHIFYQLIQAFLANKTPTLPKQIDLDTLANHIDAHQLLLTLYPLIKTHYPQEHHIHASYQKYVLQFLRYQKELISISTELNAENIPHIVLKGIPLNQQLYGNLGIRQTRDIDLLVEPSYILPAHDYLIRRGYQKQDSHHPKMITSPIKRIQALATNFTYFNPTKKTCVDLIQKKSLHSNKTQTLSLQNHDISILSTEINFIYLCLHGASHQWSCTQWLVDIAQFILTQNIDPPTVLAHAKENNLLRVLLETQKMLKRTLNISLEIPIPARAIDHIAVECHLSPIGKKYETLKKCLLYPTWEQKKEIIIERCLKTRFFENQIMKKIQ